MRNCRFKAICLAICCVLILGFASVAPAQTTEFSYQGFLSDASASANGNFDFEFRLFENVNGGIAVATQPRPNVPVTNGVFSVVLDFGNFPAANRFLEIGVRPAGGGAFTTLAPRSKLLSTPYATNAQTAQNAVNAQNSTNSTNAVTASQLNGVPANQFVQTVDPRLADARNPLPNSPNYIQNSTSPQTNGNFNISGSGTTGGTLTGNVVRATTQFNIGGSRVLSNPGTFNFFAGNNAGFNNTTGTGNSFFGINAGVFNTTGGSNAFFGFDAGRNNNSGANNSYFGEEAGQGNTSGANNSFFGNGAGATNTTASGNSFFGALAGNSNTTGANNAFFGFEAGSLNTEAFNNSFFGFNAGKLNTGDRNSFFGTRAGDSNTTGDDNSFFGTDAGAANATAVGNSFFGARGGASNTTGNKNSFFGFEAGQINTTGSNNSYFGYEAGQSNTTTFNNSFFGANTGLESAGFSNSFFGAFAGLDNTIGWGNTFLGNSSGSDNTTGFQNTLVGDLTNVALNNLTNATAIGARAVVGQSDALILGSVAGVNNANTTVNVGIGTTTPRERLDVHGAIRVTTLGAAGSTSICRNINFQLSTCSSSLRYKTAIAPFASGLTLVNQLKPITFSWKEGGMRDLGLGAEDVAAIEPLLVTYNAEGKVEGVKYDRVAMLLLNAVKEQQAQIERRQNENRTLTIQIAEQKKQLSVLQAEINELKKAFGAFQNNLLKPRLLPKINSVRRTRTSKQAR